MKSWTIERTQRKICCWAVTKKKFSGANAMLSVVHVAALWLERVSVGVGVGVDVAAVPAVLAANLPSSSR